MGEREEVEALAEVIDEAERGRLPGTNVTEAWQDRVAYGVLHSDWLRAHDERVRADERERLAAEVEALAAIWEMERPSSSAWRGAYLNRAKHLRAFAERLAGAVQVR